MRNPILRVILWLVFVLLILVAAFAVGWVLLVWIPDRIAVHDIGSAGGNTRLTARDDARARVLTLAAGALAAGALAFTALTFRLSRRTSFNTQYSAITEQIGDRQAAVRVAGLQAMARLADSWKANQQGCIDVLCAYLRMNRGINPHDRDAPQELQARRIVIRLIAEKLRTPSFWSGQFIIFGRSVSFGRRFNLGRYINFGWQGRYFDFTGVIFDGGDFNDAIFKDVYVRFDRAEFKEFDFERAIFTRGYARFNNAAFSGNVSFKDAEFSTRPDRYASFDNATFPGSVSFERAKFKRGGVSFYSASFTGNTSFNYAEFKGGTVGFDWANFEGTVSFEHASFDGGSVYFKEARFSAGTVSFCEAQLLGPVLSLETAQFTNGTVNFLEAADPGAGREKQPEFPEHLPQHGLIRSSRWW